jgi:NAD(P)-dependent dehydrogenase (short-subunit alcohol dehydrogenase family)
VIALGDAGVVISSMAGHLVPHLPPDDEQLLISTATDALLDLPRVQATALDAGHADGFAKQATLMMVKAASVPWAERGARINSISPGVIATAMGRAELAGPSGEFMDLMVRSSGTGRLGPADDITPATDFLLSQAASFITGTDLLVDGGVVAALQTGQMAADPSGTE